MLPDHCIVHTDALTGLESLKDQTVDLVVTSPPYATVRSSYAGTPAEDYAEWFSPILKEIQRILKTDGSFVLNIDDQAVGGEIIPYTAQIVVEAYNLGFHVIDKCCWLKTNGVGSTSGRRRLNYFEYIYHFSNSTTPKWNPDPIRTPYAPSSVKRAKKPIKNNVSNREARSISEYKKWILNPGGAFPKNVLVFKKDSGKDHPAAFGLELPSHFILAHTDKGDLVVDPFAGRGTTIEAARQLSRRAIGFELEKKYCELAAEKYGLMIQSLE